MENTDKYILGIYQDHEIHACPINNILQLRPAFSYFDKSDNRAKEEKKAEANADLDEEEAQQVTVSFANEFKGKTKEKRPIDESWCETMWYPKYSEEANQERRKFFAPSSSHAEHMLDLSCDEYVKMLIPPSKEDENTVKMRSNVITKVMLSQMNLADQVRSTLKDGM